MAKSDTSVKKSLLKLFKSTFSGLSECEEVDIKEAFRLPDKKVKVRIKDYPFQINLFPNSKTLHLYPEPMLAGTTPGTDTPPASFILFDPDCYYTQVSGFYRLKDGDRITLGGSDSQQQAFLNISSETPTRKLSITNDEGGLVFKSHSSNPQTCVAPLLKDKRVNQIIEWRQEKLRRIRNLYGGPIELLPPAEALTLIQQVNSILEDEAYRPKNRSGMPGGMIVLPNEAPVVLVGDLHAKPDNLLVALSQNSYLEALEEKRGFLVILGDAVHPEGDVPLDEMDSSMLMMDLIFKLKVAFPTQVFYLRGNHDSFSEEIAKGGIPQGLMWAKRLNKVRGKTYRKEMLRFYELLPYVMHSGKVIACHAAPPTSPVSVEDIVNILENPKLIGEIINNRIKLPNRLSGYSKGNIKNFRKCLGVPAETPVIVGHTPMSNDDTLWENVGDIANHHILYSSDSHWVGVMAQIGDNIYPFRYPTESLIPLINRLSD
ncbi:MAG: metallophosphoesterase [Gammaproteobacteria bacterium]|nr:metallophosphoesterase [Gammaproteobacteria bacterium]